MALTPTKSLTPAEKRAQQETAEQDVLMREVDEAVRQGDFEDMMQRWGRPALYVIIAALAIFAAYLFWESRQEDAYEKQSETLIAAMDQLKANNPKAADKKLAELAQSGGDGAAAAAAMLRAGIAVQEGRTKDAEALFAQIAAADDAPVELRELATLRSIALRYDTMKPKDAIAALKPLAVPGKPFFPSAGELLAHAYLGDGNKSEAGALFAAIAKDKDAPEALRSRSRQMAGLLGVDAIEDVDTIIERAEPAAQ